MNDYATEHLTLSYKVLSISYPKIDQFEHVENVGIILSEIHELLFATLHHKQIAGIKKKKNSSKMHFFHVPRLRAQAKRLKHLFLSHASTSHLALVSHKML